MNMHPYHYHKSRPEPPNDEPVYHHLIEHKRKRIVARIRIRPSTAKMLNDCAWMRSVTLEYVQDVQEGFQWDE